MEKLTIENFRNIEGSVTIDISPITLLIGPNNSGKSNILKMIDLFNDYITSQDHFVLSFNGKSSGKHKIDCYENAINWSNWTNDKTFRFSYERFHNRISFEFIPVEQNLKEQKDFMIQSGRLSKFMITNLVNDSKISITLDLTKNQYAFMVEQAFIESLDIRTEVDDIVEVLVPKLKNDAEKLVLQIQSLKSENASLTKNDKKYLENIEEIHKLDISLKRIRRNINEMIIKETPQRLSKNKFDLVFDLDQIKSQFEPTIPEVFHGMLEKYFLELKSHRTGYTNPRKIQNELFRFSNILRKLLSFSSTHLSPDRSHQSRIHINSDRSSEFSDLISSLTINPFIKGRPADLFIREWMNKFKIGTDYRFDSYKGFATIIEVEGPLEEWHNLVDKGFGTGQILPIILRIACFINDLTKSETNIWKEYEQKGILIIEEPEANLHPAFQAQLAEMFHEVVKKYKIQIIIETHSEYLIRKLKLLRAKNELKEREALIYYIYSKEDSKIESKHRVEKIEILENGKLSQSFGKGFFDAADEIERDLYRLSKGRE